VTASSVDCLIVAQTIGAHGMLFTLDSGFVRIASHSGLELFDANGYAPLS
jgi:hypothetical protein